MRRTYLAAAVAILGAYCATAAAALGLQGHSLQRKGYDITKTGLTPRYPSRSSCSPLTSLYASWDDVDGTRRDEPHSGVDGGRLGEAIVAPAPGVVVAVWQANWGWGEEHALLLKHTNVDLKIGGDKNLIYYSEFDHLSLNESLSLKTGQRVARGQRLATVSRPGGKEEYLPEVHWEVWESVSNFKLVWDRNKFGGRYWIDWSARLVDPLYMLSLNNPPRADLNVDVHPYSPSDDYSNFRGFTYILPCVELPRMTSSPNPLEQSSP